uniref:Amiloride-sensitive sodium channel subunit gamma n=1 Tax=Lygus hesperus TaxID=30085 RepID=A0A0A9WJA8_LYGHE
MSVADGNAITSVPSITASNASVFAGEGVKGSQISNLQRTVSCSSYNSSNVGTSNASNYVRSGRQKYNGYPISSDVISEQIGRNSTTTSSCSARERSQLATAMAKSRAVALSSRTSKKTQMDLQEEEAWQRL